MLIIGVVVQFFTGICLSFYYDNTRLAFESIIISNVERFLGWSFHVCHINYPTFIFLILYLHITKRLYVTSFRKLRRVWVLGVLLIVIIIGTCFLGYVLPWGQISLWGATVITNLLSILPYGKRLVTWVWGGFFVSVYTIKLFFSFHFMLPFILISCIFIHLILLHFKGSSNPIGDLNLNKREFLPRFLIKDMINLTLTTLFTVALIMSPYLFCDRENFIASNSIVSPVHIKPEWYFLQYYAILRCVPSKLGGIIFFVFSILIFVILTIKNTYVRLNNSNLIKNFLLLLVTVNIILIWLGGSLVEYPFLELSVFYTLMYFLLFITFFCF